MTRASAVLFALLSAVAVPLVHADEDPAAAFLVAFDPESAADSSNACSCDGRCDRSCGDGEPCWVFRGGAIILQRSAPDSTNLVAGPTSATLIDAADVGLEWEPGFDLVAKRSLNQQGRSIEARFFLIDSGDAVSTLGTPVSIVGFQGILNSAVFGVTNHDAIADYSALLRNFELNINQQVRDCWTWSLGFRYVNLEDELGVCQGTFFTHRARTQNNLFGGQVGAESWLLSCGRLTLDATAKAGLYFDEATSDYSFRFPAIPLADTDLSAGRNQLSFVGEIGLVGTYRLTNRISLRGGYQLLWIEGVAIAPDQFAALAPAPGTMAIEADGGVFYHGVIAALEVNW